MGMTGQTCQVSGLYQATGGCGHPVKRIVVKGDPFPQCKICRKVVTWKLLRPTEAT
jgi:hypothetical protein